MSNKNVWPVPSMAAAAVLFSVGLSTLALPAYGDDKDKDLEQELFQQRQDFGMYEVLLVQGLVDDMKDGVISEDDFLGIVWDLYPETTENIFTYWGDVNDCFLRDIVMIQTNGIISKDKQGKALYFKEYTSKNLVDEQLSVSPIKVMASQRANTILRGISADWESDDTCAGSLIANNRCCDQTATPETCVPKTNYRCKMSQTNDTICSSTSVKCPDVPAP